MRSKRRSVTTRQKAAKRDKPDKRAIDRNGVVDFSTGEVARRLRISSRSASRLCSTGELGSYRTPGGHIRVPLKDLENYEQRSGGADSASAPHSEPTRLSGEREHVQALNLQLQQRRIQRDLDRFDTEDREAERQHAEALAAEHARSQAAIDQARRESAERERRRLEEERQRQADQQRQQWTDHWIQYALMNLISRPDVRSRFAGEIQTSVQQALEGLSPSRAPAMVEQVVIAAARQAIEPWRRQQEVEAAIKQASKQLPLEVRHFSDFLPPTEWESRAMCAARDAIAHLAPNASLAEANSAAVGAAQRVAQEYRRGEEHERAQRQRGQQVDTYLRSLLPYLQELETDPEGYDFEPGEIFLCEERIKNAIRPKLMAEVLDYVSGPRRVRELAKQWLDASLNWGARD